MGHQDNLNSNLNGLQLEHLSWFLKQTKRFGNFFNIFSLLFVTSEEICIVYIYWLSNSFYMFV
jgi:hypothetical protein